MLKKPDAASIKEAGRFYLQVGADEVFELGQSAWAGAKYVPVDGNAFLMVVTKFLPNLFTSGYSAVSFLGSYTSAFT